LIINRKLVVVMPAYNAAETLKQTYDALPLDIVDDIILVDDASTDATAMVAEELGIKHILIHDKNLGYGGNQKSCYGKAVSLDADIIIMVHPDYQYTPKLIRAMASLIAEDVFDCVLGSRILGVGALAGGMPLYKYVANRFLTLVQNLLVSYKLAEYHTGYRAFSREVLTSLPLEKNSDDFIFDNQMLLQVISRGFSIGEITCPTSYTEEASSIAGLSAVRYGVGVLIESLLFRLDRMGVIKTRYR
jgi:glycosyltransferase involved in cell wall biosynthesis|tara:strand:+ start:2944 stop:3681 length:738 start_codon:yes stop_codon:yes gene_type:complete